MRAKFEYMDDDVTFPNTERAPKSYFWQSYHDMFLHILLKIAENPTSCGRAVGPDKTGSPLAEEGKPVNRLERFGRAADGVPPLRNQKFADSPLEVTVWSEPVSERPNSLLYREFTGNFIVFGLHAQFGGRKRTE